MRQICRIILSILVPRACSVITLDLELLYWLIYDGILPRRYRVWSMCVTKGMKDLAILTYLSVRFICFLFLEYFMNKWDRNWSFAYCGCNTLDTSTTNVTYRENTWQTGFEQVWWTRKRPACSAQIFWWYVLTCLYEAFIVKCDTAVKPTGVWISTSHNEYVAYLVLLGQSCLIVSPGNEFGVIASFYVHNLGLW